MGAPGPSVGGFLRGRANRKEYWLLVGLVLAVGLAVTAAVPPAVQSTGVAVVTYAQIRRLHDLGRTGWWVVVIAGGQIAAALGGIAAGLSEEGILVVGLPLVVGPILLIGALPGQRLENRFGPEPGKRPLKEIFS